MLLSTDFCCIILRGRGIISVFLRKITLVLVSSIAAIVRFLFLCQRKMKCYSGWKQQALIHLTGRCRKGCYALFCHSDFLKCRVSLIKCRPPIPIFRFLFLLYVPCILKNVTAFIWFKFCTTFCLNSIYGCRALCLVCMVTEW